MPAQKYTTRLPIQDSPITRGMNTMSDPKVLEVGECVQLTNMFPGKPLTPRNGCPGYLFSPLPGEAVFRDRWVSPAISFNATNNPDIPGTSTYVIAWIYNDGAGVLSEACQTVGQVALALWLIDGSYAQWLVGTGYTTDKIFRQSFQNIYDCIYSIIGSPLIEWGPNPTPGWTDDSTPAALALSHKVIENINIYKSAHAQDNNIVRDMCISVPGIVSQLNLQSGTTFSAGDCLAYGFQFVRRMDVPAFDNGPNYAHVIIPPAAMAAGLNVPKTITTFLPGSCIGVADPRNILSEKLVSPGNIGVLLAPGGSFTTDPVNLAIKQAIAQGATHLRICRSRSFQTNVQDAQDSTLYWLIDIGISADSEGTYYSNDGGTFVDSTSDATLSGETNQLVVGWTAAPQAIFSKFFKGRLFIMNLAGKVYYSLFPGEDGQIDADMAQEYPQYAASLFSPLTRVIDCDSAEGSNASGIEILDNDVYFFKENKIWALYAGDPSATPPTLLNNGNIGCLFPHTIITFNVSQLGNCIFFVSNQGPAIITSGGVIQLFSTFKIREFWPDKAPNGTATTNLFVQLGSQIVDESNAMSPTRHEFGVQNCNAFFANNTIWCFYETAALGNIPGVRKMFGYYFDPTSTSTQGPLEIKLADNNIFGSILVGNIINGKNYLFAYTNFKNAVLEFLQKSSWEDMDMSIIESTVSLATATPLVLNAPTALAGNLDKRGLLVTTYKGATKSGASTWVIGKSSVLLISGVGDVIAVAYSSSNYQVSHVLGETITLTLKFIGDN